MNDSQKLEELMTLTADYLANIIEVKNTATQSMNSDIQEIKLSQKMRNQQAELLSQKIC